MILLAGILWAQQQPVAAPRSLDVRVSTSELVAVTDPFTVQVEIRNTTTDKTFSIEKIKVDLPEAFQMGKRRGDVDIPVPSALVLQPGSAVMRFVDFGRGSFFESPRRCVIFRCANYRIRALVSYRVAGSTVEEEIVAFTTLRPRAALAAVMFGGFAGVVLATIFSLSRKASARTAQPPLHRIKDILLTILYGTVATAAAILLLSATTVSDFPVSISVCDALGGLILGLFFKPVGDYIQSKTAAAEESK